MMRCDILSLWRGSLAVLPTLGVALFGLSALGWLMLTSASAQADGGASQIGIVIPPWSQGGMAVAAGFDLPIIDLRWGGHLVVVDVTAKPNARHMMQAAGYLVINTAVPSGCFVQGKTSA